MVKIKLDQKLSHVLSDLTSGDNTPDLTDAKVTLLNVNTSVIFNRKTGAVSNPTNKKDVKLNKGGSGGIIIPQKIAVDTKFAKICLKDGKEMFYTKTTSLTEAENKKHTVNLKINKTETVGMRTEVGEWDKGGSSGGEAREDNSKKCYLQW